MPSRDLRGLRNHHIASFHQVNYFKATVIGCIVNCICNFQFPAWMASPGWPSSSVILALQRKMLHSLSVPQVQIDLPYFEENDQPGFHSRFAHPSLFWTRWCSTPLRTLPLCFQVIFEYSTFISHDYIGQKVRVFFKVLEKVTTTSTLNLPQRSWRMTKSRVECLLMHGDLLHNQIFSNNGPHILLCLCKNLTYCQNSALPAHIGCCSQLTKIPWSVGTVSWTSLKSLCYFKNCSLWHFHSGTLGKLMPTSHPLSPVQHKI